MLSEIKIIWNNNQRLICWDKKIIWLVRVLRIKTNQTNLRDWVNEMNVKNPIISVVDRKLCINDIIFEHNQLRESKQYLQSLGYSEVIFYPANDEDLNELEEVMAIMSDKNQEASGNEIPSYYLN